MGMRSVSAPRRRWPVLLLIISAVVAFAVTAAGETAGARALAYAWVLSCAVLVGLARRADHGLPVRRAAAVAAAAASGAFGVLLLLLAEQTRQSLLLLAVAVGFCAAVLLLGAWLVLAGISDPPAWLRSDDGFPVPARQRLGCALRHTATLARQHPHRSPARVLSHAQRDMNRMVWTLAPAQVWAFSHFEVALHPRTLARLDGWLPVEHLARELALGYAEAHRDLPSRSNHVVVHIAADEAVPLGAAVIAGSFVEPRLQSPTAKAWARLHGLPDEYGLDGAYRFPAAVDPDRTQVLAPRTDLDAAAGPAAAPDPDRTAVLGRHAGRLRR